MEESGPQDPSNKDQWRARHLAWKESGLSVRAFCKRENIGLNSFWYWKKKIESRGKGGSMVKVPARLSHLLAPIEVVVSGRFTVRVPGGFRAEELIRLIEVLEGLSRDR